MVKIDRFDWSISNCVKNITEIHKSEINQSKLVSSPKVVYLTWLFSDRNVDKQEAKSSILTDLSSFTWATIFSSRKEFLWLLTSWAEARFILESGKCVSGLMRVPVSSRATYKIQNFINSCKHKKLFSYRNIKKK